MFAKQIYETKVWVTAMDRSILHVDLNNFYASVECLYRPELKLQPMAVAGDPEKRHGIVLAKNQLAKEKGVKTAEPLWQASRKCPGIIFVPPNHERYDRFSKAAMMIYSRYTDQLESFGQDECWLDVTGSKRLFGSGEEIAEKISSSIKDELGLTVSIGVSFNKIFAKLGSDYKKPDAITMISRRNFRRILWPLPVEDLLYVGPSTKKLLSNWGVKTIGDLAQTDKALLSKVLGKCGAELWEHANGLDTSPVSAEGEGQEIKSIGHSTTTPKDLRTDQEVRKVLYDLSEQVAHRLRAAGLWAGGVQLSVRRHNLESYQRSCSLEAPAADSKSLFEAAFSLYRRAKEKEPIRSLGVRAERLSGEGGIQCSMFQKENQALRRVNLETAADRVRSKYGDESLRRAAFYGTDI